MGDRKPLPGPVLHRAAGVLLGMAAGDALGAGYEFGSPLPADAPVAMVGGGSFGWQPGEWTDDTSMAVVIAQAAVQHGGLGTPAALDQVAGGWYRWSRSAPDVGHQTRTVLSAGARSGSPPAASDLIAASRRYAAANPKGAGNGSLMRTAPVALAFLDDADGLVAAATTLSDMTHGDPTCAQACVLWCLAIRHAVRTGELDVRVGLPALEAEARAYWSARIAEAEAAPPEHFPANGWVVQALQGAWSAICNTPAPPDRPSAGSFAAQHLADALTAAVRGGHDTDTVAAIAGSLLGAAYGASALPGEWRRVLHGWPELRARDIVRLGVQVAAGRADRGEWPGVAHLSYEGYGEIGQLATHPHDRGVLIGGVDTLRDLPEGVTAVVSLCRLGTADVPARGVAAADHAEVWLVDRTSPAANPHLDFVLDDAANLVASLRNEGHTVLLHCVQARSRTPTVAALYGARVAGIPVDKALAKISEVLPGTAVNETFRGALQRLTGS